MANQLPNTKARISTSMSIEAVLRNDAGDEIGRRRIGAVEEFDERNPRRTHPRYEFDADRPGDIVERIPEVVDRTLRINRAILNTSDMLQAFNTTDTADLIDMYKPFDLVKKEKYPDSLGGGTKVTEYRGCWLHDNPKTYNLSGDLKIVQNVEIGYTTREVTTPNDADEGLAERIG